MHLLYLDHAGDVNDNRQKYVVLAGVSVFERQSYWLSQKLDEIAARFNPAEPQFVELHASRMRGGSSFWRRFPKEDRHRAILDALALVRDFKPAINLFGAVVEKAAINAEDPIRCIRANLHSLR